MLAKVIVLAFCVSIVWASSCSYTDENGTSWDLSSLTYDPSGAAPAGYSITDSSEFTYYINFCEEVSTTIGDNACNLNGESGCCQIVPSGDYFNAGSVESMTWVPYQSDGNYISGIGIQYSDGQFCPATQTNRKTTIYVSCDPAGTNELYSVTSINGQCDYTLYFSSPHGCQNQNLACEAFQIQVSVDSGVIDTFGTTVGAEPYVNGDCDTGTSGTAWYSVSVDADTKLTASTCSVNTNFDTTLGLYSGNCTALQCEAFNDDAVNCTGGQSTLERAITEAGVYYITVSGWDSASGQFQLSVMLESTTPVSDPSCLVAIQIFNSITIQDTNVNSPISVTSQCGLTGNRADWFLLNNASNATITASTCNTFTTFAANLVALSNSCTASSCISSAQSCSNGSSNGQELTISNEGDKVYVVVYGANGATGNYQLVVNYTE